MVKPRMFDHDPRLTPARADLAASHLHGVVKADRYVDGRKMHVIWPFASLQRAPAHDAALDTQVLHGETVTLYDEEEGWGFVQLARDGYVGYLSTDALAEGPLQPTLRVTVNRTFIYPAPDLKLPVVGALPLGAGVSVQDRKGSFAQIGVGAYVFAEHLAPYDEKQSDFVAVAERLLHAPYLWGGKTSLGIDCSGLVQLSLGEAGILAPRDTDLQEAALGSAVPLNDDLEDLRRGDLVFWRGHVGIMQDEARLLHANAHHMLVASEPLRAARDRIRARSGAEITSIKRL
jgi:cell wall-associated NlpC family hydrolase